MLEEDAPVSQAQTIRAIMAEHPDASAKAVAEALAAQGIEVSPGLVAAVRAALKSPGPSIPEPESPPRHIPVEEGKLFYKLYARFVHRRRLRSDSLRTG